MNPIFRKLLRWLNDYPIRQKLLMLLFVSSIIPLLIVTVYGAVDSQNRVQRQTEEELRNMRQRLSAGVESILTPIEQISSLIYTDTALLEQIDHSYVTDMEWLSAYNSLSGKLTGFLVANGNIDRLTIYTDNTTVAADGFFIRAKEDGFPFQDTYVLPRVSVIAYLSTQDKRGEAQIAFGRPLNYSYTSNYTHQLVITVKENVFSAFLPDAQGVRAFVTAPDGTIMSATEKALLGQSIESVCGELLSRESGAVFSTRLDGQKYSVTCETLNSGWGSIVAISRAEVYSDSLRDAGRTFLIFGICIVLACLLIILISHYFSQRFHSLMAQIESIEGIDFSTATPETSADEIGRLSAAVNKMSAALDRAINDIYVREIQQKSTELQLLQSQINPHLLYNSLSAISSMALHEGNTELGAFTNHLSQFYRLSLSKGQKYIPLQKEIELTKHYIAVQEARFPEMFEFLWEVDETLLACPVPKLILQPFVENVINHAAKSTQETIFVVIHIALNGNNIVCTISDNGVGIPQTLLAELLDPLRSTGYGLVNVNERIRLCFGAEYGVSLNSEENVGTTASITIPNAMYAGDTIRSFT